MNKNWSDIKWIFEADGSLRDIYIQDISINDWKLLIKFLNNSHKLSFDESEKIDIQYVLNFLTDSTGKMEGKSAYIDLEGITIACHFFLTDQIEFDLEPSEINSFNDFIILKEFMKSVSSLLHNQVTLTAENSPQLPLIKIDVKNNINKILTEPELGQFQKKSNPDKNMDLGQSLNEQLLKSANKPYSSTKKSENLW
jgi:hypothetical protein